MEKAIQKEDVLYQFYGLTPLWDTYYERKQNMKFKNKWENVKAGWRPRRK